MTDKECATILDNHVIVIYDGDCGFCDASIQFILKCQPSNKIIDLHLRFE